MQLIIKQNILSQLLSHVNRVIERRLAIPVLGCVLFNATSGKLQLTATNTDMTSIATAKCDVVEEGKYCLPAGLLYDIVKKLSSNADIVFESNKDNKTIKVTSNRTSFNLHYVDSDAFPPTTIETTNIKQFLLNTHELSYALNTSKIAMSQDASRLQLNGIYIHIDNGQINYVATDLFRIAKVSLAWGHTEKFNPIIISKRTVGEILHLIDETNDDLIQIQLNSGQITFNISLKDDITVEHSARLVNGDFPEYQSAINIKNEKSLEINTQEFICALDRVSTIVSSISNSIKLSLCNNKLLISGVSKEFGSADEELDVIFNSQLDICFNSKYLIELLKQINTEKVKLLFDTSTSPTIIMPVGANNTVFVIMPIEIINS